LRASPGVGLGPGVLEFRGGVLEITGGGVFNRHLDYGSSSGPGRVSWTAVSGLPDPSLSKEDRGSGGFAAVGADVVVDLNGLGPSDIVWEDPAFIESGYALILGSRGANARVELVDNFGLGLSPGAYNPREIRVVDNPDSSFDVARLSGVIFSDSASNNGVLTDLLKTGDGTLELTGNNTYIGGTVIAEGTLLAGPGNALGQPGRGAYVLLGNRGGTADAALLTSAPISIARDVTIPVGGSGKATLGTIMPGSSTYAGEITIGTGGATASKVVDLFAEAGGTAVFSAGIASPPGYAGNVTLNKNGPGEVVFDAVNTIHGETRLMAGSLRVDGTLDCRDIFVGEGGTLTGSGYLKADTLAVAGIVSPGNLSPSTLHFTGNLAFAPTAGLEIELYGTAPQGGYDRLHVAGAIDLGGASLGLSLGYAPSRGDSYVILENATGNLISGEFADLPDGSTFRLGDYFYRIDYRGGDGNDVALTVPYASVVGRHVFYDNSSFDTNSPGPGLADDQAVATNKQALLPGQTATFENYTSFSSGINGVMIDVDGPTKSDQLDADHIGDFFRFRVGNSNDPGSWQNAPPIEAVAVRPDAGVDNSDRVTITWVDDAIRNQWLQVTMLANEFTQLAEQDVFYFGNAVGEAGNSDTNSFVTVADLLLARNNPRSFLDPAPVGFPYDYNRDGRVNSTDVLLARNNQTGFLNSLQLISAPPRAAATRIAPVPEPSALVMLCSAAAGRLAFAYRRRRRHGKRGSG